MSDQVGEEQLQKTIHLKNQVWTKDKETGMIPCFIISSFHFEKEEIKEFSKGGKFDEAYDAYREFLLRKTPNLNFVGEIPK